jgi:Ser/Thr protein kinase RdoA (MazF antagonist)
METTFGPSGLTIFDALRRGEEAPEWVHDQLARAWGLSDFSVRLIVLSENVTFRVDRERTPQMVVRLSRPGYVGGADHIRSELSWIDAIRADARVQTPAAIPTIHGDFVASLVDPRGGVWTAVAFEFVAGRILEDEDDLLSRYGEIGRLTAILHEHSTGWNRPPGFERFRWDVSDLVGPSARWGDWRAAELSSPELTILERAEASALATLQETGIDTSPRHFGLIHGDLRPSNLMIPHDGANPLIIIDFDDSGFGYYLYDFAAALTFYEHREDAPAMAANWLSGYRSQRALSFAELRAAVALSMVRRLTMLGWATTHRSDALPDDLWNENQPGTVWVAERYLADPLWLIRD